MNKILYEILVPTATNDGAPVPISHHKLWDDKVHAISGGLTILNSVQGIWDSQREKMIPVKILCTQDEMAKIVRLTFEHYADQDEIMYYEISRNAHIIKRGDGDEVTP